VLDDSLVWELKSLKLKLTLKDIFNQNGIQMKKEKNNVQMNRFNAGKRQS